MQPLWLHLLPEVANVTRLHLLPEVANVTTLVTFATCGYICYLWLHLLPLGYICRMKRRKNAIFFVFFRLFCLLYDITRKCNSKHFKLVAFKGAKSPIPQAKHRPEFLALKSNGGHFLSKRQARGGRGRGGKLTGSHSLTQGRAFFFFFFLDSGRRLRTFAAQKGTSDGRQSTKVEKSRKKIVFFLLFRQTEIALVQRSFAPRRANFGGRKPRRARKTVFFFLAEIRSRSAKIRTTKRRTLVAERRKKSKKDRFFFCFFFGQPEFALVQRNFASQNAHFGGRMPRKARKKPIFFQPKFALVQPKFAPRKGTLCWPKGEKSRKKIVFFLFFRQTEIALVQRSFAPRRANFGGRKPRRARKTVFFFQPKFALVQPKFAPRKGTLCWQKGEKSRKKIVFFLFFFCQPEFALVQRSFAPRRAHFGGRKPRRARKTVFFFQPKFALVQPKFAPRKGTLCWPERRKKSKKDRIFCFFQPKFDIPIWKQRQGCYICYLEVANVTVTFAT